MEIHWVTEQSPIGCNELQLLTMTEEMVVCTCVLSLVQFSATLWTIACQAPLPMGFPKQEYWSGLPFPSPGDLPDTGIEPGSPTLQADALPSEPLGKPKDNM